MRTIFRARFAVLSKFALFSECPNAALGGNIVWLSGAGRSW